MILGEDKWLLFTGRHFWNRKCRKKTWWQQEFAVFKCEATANSVTGHVCVNSNDTSPYVGISIKKNVPWHILAPSAVACDMFLLRASAHPRGAFFVS